ncbi:hypothetical protein HCN44_005665 [Aphidius gifuensis]|uniref:Uncharacterized protein n=1 Tax=Aphidius gifuensis TaxID=684658 RepID=A0A834Y594_APHGI|nr:transmembrane protein 43 homolog [Aphidius gifuensis]KAF7997388.1 hypothetical protein HCN44_005665 [Aphidius gifuensis]
MSQNRPIAVSRRHPNQRNDESVESNSNNSNRLLQNNRLPPSIVEQFRESWLTAIIGLILFATGMCLLFWNEGKAASIAQSLDEALENIALISDIQNIPEEYNGRLVHLSGPLSINEPLTEPDYGIVVDSVKLKRRVQMYQWIEYEDSGLGEAENHDDPKNYYYTTEWKDKLIDSDSFYIRNGHENPTEIPIKSQIQIAEEVKIGNVILGDEMKNKFTEFLEITSDQRPDRVDIKMHSGLYYHSADLWNPHVGDIRILFLYAGKANDIYSIVGKLSDGIIVPYVTTRNEVILLQRKHTVDVHQMFHLEHVHNYWRTWTIRGLGWLVLFLAATCLANILKTIITNSSFLYGIIEIDSITMSVSMSISLLVVGFAWVWYRPIVALCLALASIVPFIYSTFFSNDDERQQGRAAYRRI